MRISVLLILSMLMLGGCSTMKAAGEATWDVITMPYDWVVGDDESDNIQPEEKAQ